MKSINIQVGKNLAAVRKDVGLNQMQVATGIGITRTSISNIEKGRQSLSIYLLLKMCSIFKCSATEILPPVPKSIIKKSTKIIKIKKVEEKTLDVNFKW